MPSNMYLNVFSILSWCNALLIKSAVPKSKNSFPENTQSLCWLSILKIIWFLSDCLISLEIYRNKTCSSRESDSALCFLPILAKFIIFQRTAGSFETFPCCSLIGKRDQSGSLLSVYPFFWVVFLYETVFILEMILTVVIFYLTRITHVYLSKDRNSQKSL